MGDIGKQGSGHEGRKVKESRSRIRIQRNGSGKWPKIDIPWQELVLFLDSSWYRDFCLKTLSIVFFLCMVIGSSDASTAEAEISGGK